MKMDKMKRYELWPMNDLIIGIPIFLPNQCQGIQNNSNDQGCSSKSNDKFTNGYNWGGEGLSSRLSI